VSDFDDWVEELGAVLAAPDLPRLQRNEPGLDKKWKAGDIAAGIPKDMLEKVADKVGVSVGLLRSYADVARAFPPQERTVRAAWTIYREVRALPPEQRKIVLRDGLTLRRARMAVGKGAMDRPRKERQSDEQRAWFILDELGVPGIRAIVEREMASSALDRKTRRAAKSSLDDIAARRKLIDGELRKRAREGSPDRQYWTARKELNDAERFIYSVGRLHDQHVDALADDQWREAVELLRNLAASALDVARQIQGVASGDYIDGEEVPEFLALTAGSEEIIDAEIIGD
jgi:hypothetical protein